MSGPGPTPPEAAPADGQQRAAPGETETPPSTEAQPAVQQTPLSLQEPVLLPPRGLVAVIVLALGMTAAVAVLWPGGLEPGTRPTLRLTSWSPTVDELARIDARRVALLRSQTSEDATRLAQEAEILAGLAQWMRQEQELGYEGARHDAATRFGLGQTEEKVRGLALRYGKEAVRALAVRYARETLGLLLETLASTQQQHLDFGALATGEPGHPALAPLRAAAPGMARALAQAGLHQLIADPSVRAAAGLVVEALVEQRVLQLCQRVPAPRPELGSDLARILLRFRVEAHSGLTLRRRLELLDQLAAGDPTYPAIYVQAVLFARAGRWRAAREGFLKAAEAGQQRVLARANARMCRERLLALGDD